MKNALHSVLVRNASGEEIPAFAVMVITGTERIDDKTVICIVDKYTDSPEVDGKVRMLVNSGKPIGINGDERYGWARVPTQLPGWVLYESGATPEFGDEYGPVDSEWYISADGTGFHILGLPDAVTERVLCLRDFAPVGQSIRFTIVSVDSVNDTAEVTVDNVSCGGSFPDPFGPAVVVYDAIGCLLDEDEADLIGRKGYAIKMKDPDNDGDCRYEIHSLCCQTS